jgi:RNA polymerase sigma-70 factor, ECF subfamily
MSEVDSLWQRAAAGDVGAWGALIMVEESRLRRMAAFRIDRRLQGRIDAADVVQEAYAEAAARQAEFFGQQGTPLFLWLRGIVANKLREVHRHHLGVQMRAAGREAARRDSASSDATSAALVEQLACDTSGPGTAAGRREVKVRLHEALNAMNELDREALALRHFEQLTNAEVAQVLEIQERAAAQRYVRALKRLKEILASMPGGLTGLKT